jgi:hypothetical protein
VYSEITLEPEEPAQEHSKDETASKLERAICKVNDLQHELDQTYAFEFLLNRFRAIGASLDGLRTDLILSETAQLLLQKAKQVWHPNSKYFYIYYVF